MASKPLNLAKLHPPGIFFKHVICSRIGHPPNSYNGFSTSTDFFRSGSARLYTTLNNFTDKRQKTHSPNNRPDIDESVEFYKANLGPGSYNIPHVFDKKINVSVIINKTPSFSFPKSPKLKLRLNDTPGVGKYFTNKRLSSETPSYLIPRSSKEDKYWSKRLSTRSPGPVYFYSMSTDVSSNQNRQKAVFWF